MRRFFIASHGRFASGLKTSLEILLGKADQVTVFDAYLDERRVKDEVESFFKSVSSDDQIFLMSDLYGGSVNSELYAYAGRPNTLLIAGVNLALVLELVCGETPISEAEVLELIEHSRQALRLVKQDNEDIVKDDFF